MPGGEIIRILTDGGLWVKKRMIDGCRSRELVYKDAAQHDSSYGCESRGSRKQQRARLRDRYGERDFDIVDDNGQPTGEWVIDRVTAH